MPKLTPDVDEKVIERAKGRAAREGKSVSQLVMGSCPEVASSREAGPGETTPVLRCLRGCLNGVDFEAHRRHLEAKYR